MLQPIKEGYEYLKQLYKAGRLMILDIGDINSIEKIESLINKHKDKKLFLAIYALYNLMTQDKQTSRGIRDGRGPALFPSRDQVYSSLFSVLDYKTRPVDLSIFKLLPISSPPFLLARFFCQRVISTLYLRSSFI